jgi:hypothetical protein
LKIKRNEKFGSLENLPLVEDGFGRSREKMKEMLWCFERRVKTFLKYDGKGSINKVFHQIFFISDVTKVNFQLSMTLQ